jgi:hypothetical protein
LLNRHNRTRRTVSPPTDGSQVGPRSATIIH